MTRGVRWIDGREFILCGRHTEKESAKRAAAELAKSWERVRIIKINEWDYMLYVHGGRPTSRIA